MPDRRVVLHVVCYTIASSIPLGPIHHNLSLGTLVSAKAPPVALYVFVWILAAGKSISFSVSWIILTSGGAEGP